MPAGCPELVGAGGPRGSLRWPVGPAALSGRCGPCGGGVLWSVRASAAGWLDQEPPEAGSLGVEQRLVAKQGVSIGWVPKASLLCVCAERENGLTRGSQIRPRPFGTCKIMKTVFPSGSSGSRIVHGVGKGKGLFLALPEPSSLAVRPDRAHGHCTGTRGWTD